MINESGLFSPPITQNNDSTQNGYAAANLKPNEINNLLKNMVTSRSENLLVTTDYDGLTLKEMREFVLAMIQRKDDLEEKFKRLELNYKEELSKNTSLEEKLSQFEKEHKTSADLFENRIQNLENENKLLKDQLKKYVSAVQMIRSNNHSNVSSNLNNSEQISLMPAVNQSLQRDYSYEAEQYEKKLIQVISFWHIRYACWKRIFGLNY